MITRVRSSIYIQFGCNVFPIFYRFDFANANLNNREIDEIKAEKLPDVVRLYSSLSNL